MNDDEYELHVLQLFHDIVSYTIVISYVDQYSRDVADEIKAVIADESKTFERLFSRNKMLRRKIKRRKQSKITA